MYNGVLSTINKVLQPEENLIANFLTRVLVDRRSVFHLKKVIMFYFFELKKKYSRQSNWWECTRPFTQVTKLLYIPKYHNLAFPLYNKACALHRHASCIKYKLYWKEIQVTECITGITSITIWAEKSYIQHIIMRTLKDSWN